MSSLASPTAVTVPTTPQIPVKPHALEEKPHSVGAIVSALVPAASTSPAVAAPADPVNAQVLEVTTYHGATPTTAAQATAPSAPLVPRPPTKPKSDKTVDVTAQDHSASVTSHVATPAVSSSLGLMTAEEEALISSTPTPKAATTSATVTTSASNTTAPHAAAAASSSTSSEELQAALTDPTYAPYLAQFRKYDKDQSNSIDTVELAALLRDVGFNFSPTIISAVMAQYFPGQTILNFVDFLKLMTHVLADLDQTLRQHILGAVSAASFQCYGVDEVVNDLMGYVAFDLATADYNFQAVELRLSELQKVDHEHYLSLHPELVPAATSATTAPVAAAAAAAPAPVPALATGATTASALQQPVAIHAALPTLVTPHNQENTDHSNTPALLRTVAVAELPFVATKTTTGKSGPTLLARSLSSVEREHSHVSLAPGAFRLDADDELFVEQAFALFLQEYDADKDGAIGRAELGPVLRALGVHPSDGELASLFTQIDTDGSGRIDVRELKLYYANFWRQRIVHGVDSDQIQDLFAAFDHDGSGEVSLPEFKAVHSTRVTSVGRRVSLSLSLSLSHSLLLSLCLFLIFTCFDGWCVSIGERIPRVVSIG
jgi:Ca2+-binding EF-hand superfamily protein